VGPQRMVRRAHPRVGSAGGGRVVTVRPPKRGPSIESASDQVVSNRNSRLFVYMQIDSRSPARSSFCVSPTNVSAPQSRPGLASDGVLLILTGSVAAVIRSAIVARCERATAVRRLAEVRALAHFYILDLDPNLRDIPGTIGVRQFGLQNAQKYLAAMSQEAANDDDPAPRDRADLKPNRAWAARVRAAQLERLPRGTGVRQ
jgi:hypothetical protein